MNICDFTLEHYREVIAKALTSGYRIYCFRDWVNGTLHGNRTLLLRHDVDVSLENAVRLAKVEAELGISATYFIRLHARYYQPLTPESWTYLNELRQGGADIGLHYERNFYEITGNDDHVEMLAQDVKILSSILGEPIGGSAAHMPKSFAPFDMATVQGIGLDYEAYALEFTRKRKYISDSRRCWREGCLCQWLGKADHLTVLTHPIWWLSASEEAPQILERLQAGD